MEKWFAWHPVQLEEGTWAWMRWVQREIDVIGLQVSSMIGSCQNWWKYY